MDISELREEIDKADEKILALLNRRYEFVKKIGDLKKSSSRAIYVPEREKTVFKRLEKLNKGPLGNDALRAIYREIMSGAIELEKHLEIAYFGQEASFTHLAAIAKFGHCASYLSRNSIPDVFSDVETGRLDYGVVPIENSTEGAVNHTLDMFINSNAKICAEINMRIHHNLISRIPMDQIRRIYSHAQVIGQCRGWLMEKMPRAELIEVSSSSTAAERAASERHSAAIASSLAAETYGLKILASNIEDNIDNTTRFMVIGRQEPVTTGDDKTSICYAIKDRVGALYDSLLPFKNAQITLTMIESRPSKRKNWEYFFFVDLLGHQSDPKLAAALEKVQKICQFLKILGSYPRTSEII